MAALSHKSRKLAKQLAHFTVEAGEQAAAEIRPALDRLIGDGPLAERRAFVKAYLHHLKRELRATRLIIEHAGAVSEDAVHEITRRFTARSPRELTTVTRENPDLIAGLRLINGDNVFDASVAGRLERFAAVSQ